MLTSPFEKISKSAEKKGSIVLLLFLIALIILMRYFDAPLKNTICQKGIVSFELAKELESSKAIINSWDIQAVKSAYLSLSVDFLFLIVYALFIGLLIYKIVKKLRENSFFSNLGKLLIWGVFLAALFDVIENIALLQLLSGNLNQVWSSTAYYFAVSKFLLIFGCIVYILIGWLLVLVKKFSHKTS